jgi:prepilin-type processing-associated H-X9-DG protein
VSSSTYSVIIGAESAFTGSLPKKITGMSNTIVLAERRTPVVWMNPSGDISFAAACKGINVDAMGIGSYHPEGSNVAFGDARVQFITNTINSTAALRAMLTVKEEE